MFFFFFFSYIPISSIYFDFFQPQQISHVLFTACKNTLARIRGLSGVQCFPQPFSGHSILALKNWTSVVCFMFLGGSLGLRLFSEESAVRKSTVARALWKATRWWCTAMILGWHVFSLEFMFFEGVENISGGDFFFGNKNYAHRSWELVLTGHSNKFFLLFPKFEILWNRFPSSLGF